MVVIYTGDMWECSVYIPWFDILTSARFTVGHVADCRSTSGKLESARAEADHLVRPVAGDIPDL